MNEKRYNRDIKRIEEADRFEKERFELCCAVLTDRFVLTEIVDDFSAILNPFQTIADYDALIVRAYVPPAIFPVQNALFIIGNGFAYAETVFMGYMRMKLRFSSAVIRPETAEDKFGKLIGYHDGKLSDNKKFNSLFHISSDNMEKLNAVFPEGLCNKLISYPGLMMELNGNECIYFSSSRSISPNEAKKICDLTADLKSYLQ